MVSASKSTIVILDHSKTQRDFFRLLLSEHKYLPFFFEKKTCCLDNIKALDPDLVILGSLLPGQTLRIIHALRVKEGIIPVLVISEDPAVYEFIVPHNFEHVRFVRSEKDDEIKIRRIITDMLKPGSMTKHGRATPLIIGRSTEMKRIKKMIAALSRSTEPVLIRGEPGTGKELAAKVIHCLSNREKNRFAKIDCAALSEEMDVSPGHDAVAEHSETVLKTHSRQFEKADAGTLFFKEIGKISPSLQTELFLLLEEGAVSDSKSQTKTPMDIRIVASTCMDLSRLVETGAFRKDLYFRLNVFSIDMPALRDLKRDIPRLVEYFTDRFCMESGRCHFDVPQDAKNIFVKYSWPGNVAELESKIKQVLLHNDENWMIDPTLLINRDSKLMNLSDFREYIDSLAGLSDVKNYTRDLSNISLKCITEEFGARAEKKLIHIGLERTGWNRVKAAALLNISYKTLLNKIKAYRLTSPISKTEDTRGLDHSVITRL